MGVVGLIPLLRRHAPNTLCEKAYEESLEAMRGCRLAIDADGMSHRYMHAMYTEQQPHKYKMELVRQARTLMDRYGIQPIYVFDGEKPKCKQDELARRREKVDYEKRQLEKSKQELQHAKQEQQAMETVHHLQEAVVKHEKRAAYMTRDDMLSIQALFTYHQIPYIIATGEGEKTCAWLSITGMVDWVASDDTDCLAYGAKRLLMNFMSRSKPCIEIYLAEVLKTLDLTQSMFVDVCILCGCDFVKVPGFAHGTAYTSIREHGSAQISYKQHLATLAANQLKREKKEKKALAKSQSILTNTITLSTPTLPKKRGRRSKTAIQSPEELIRIHQRQFSSVMSPFPAITHSNTATPTTVDTTIPLVGKEPDTLDPTTHKICLAIAEAQKEFYMDLTAAFVQ